MNKNYRLRTCQQRIVGTSMLAIAIMGTNAYALQFGKPITTTVTVSHPGTGVTKKTVTLMNIKLTPNQMRNIIDYKPRTSTTMKYAMSTLPSTINLGMNGVPVLDQGSHGSCVTFAVTAALDAILGKGDYISQLCNLTLGTYLENVSYMPSGWDGTEAPLVLDQISRFGIVNKENQRNATCGGLKEYPGDTMDNVDGITTPEDFRLNSEAIDGEYYALEWMNASQRFDTRFADTDQADQALMQVKRALTKGHRLTVAVLLNMSPYCNAAACATHNTANDTWANTRELELPPSEFGGHEMVVTGFDDKAMAIEANGTRHIGLLTLRNSWGSDMGDNGDFYMTYDFFKKYAWEVQEIVDRV